MHTVISNSIIRQFDPCYDPSKFITDENEELTVKQWIEKYRKVIPAKDIIWLLLRKEFLSEKDLRLFAVWCARETLKLIVNPDERSVNACNVAEKYANGEATQEELLSARDAANDGTYVAYYAALSAANIGHAYVAYAAFHAAYSTVHASDVNVAARAATSAASYADADVDVADAAQINQLLSYFE